VYEPSEYISTIKFLILCTHLLVTNHITGEGHEAHARLPVMGHNLFKALELK
jgi:hypothetical protein